MRGHPGLAALGHNQLVHCSDPDSYPSSPYECVCWSVLSIWLASITGVQIRAADLGYRASHRKWTMDGRSGTQDWFACATRPPYDVEADGRGRAPLKRYLPRLGQPNRERSTPFGIERTWRTF